jgi:hypothetical protein
MPGSGDHGNEPSDSVKGSEFLYNRKDFALSRWLFSHDPISFLPSANVIFLPEKSFNPLYMLNPYNLFYLIIQITAKIYITLHISHISVRTVINIILKSIS